ncbi:MAG: DUF3592 domain-containing protein [Planctomycetaceae bacterium]|nr:DUF3592 domain-containing protein [Planctomycetaceae bacterium]
MSRGDEKADRKKALSVDHNRLSGCGMWGLYVFCGMFALAGAAMFYFMTLGPLLNVYRARTWVETPCTITSSRVERHDGDDGDTFSIEITYDYAFRGQPYGGDRYHFMIGSSSGYDGKKAVVDAHPVGMKTVCYVDPLNPSEAVIERGLTWDMLWGLFCVPFLVVGFGIPWAVRWSERKKQRTALSTGGGSSDGNEVGSTQFNENPDGSITLQSESSPLGRFMGSIIIALIWNGLISFLIRQVVEGFQNGDPEWFLTVFSIPFVLVGLGLIIWAVYAFFALFNPRPILTLNRGQIPLGEVVHMTWQFRGSSHSIRHLKLTLVGSEKATYRRGTNTHTDKEKFHEQVLFESDQSYDIASGEADIEVPADSMHTFTANNNEIVWTLEMAGDIPLRPDVSATFPIVVTPHEKEG